MKRIAIQGLVGSFHDIAAHQYFEGEQIQLICCATFEDVFAQMQQDPTVIGMLAIENTIVGEHKLHIEHCICCLPDDDWDTLTEVHSHPVALMQCRGFLATHPALKAVEGEDTAGSAKLIAEGQLRHQAAICSAAAARLYGLKVLEDHIEDNKHNYTRFLVVSNPAKADMMRALNESDKSSLVFSLDHKAGSLSHVLSVLSFYDINLTKIQSLPVIGHEWEYLFYVDVTYDNITRYRQCIDAIMPLTKELKILGEYQNGKQSA